MSSHPVNLQRFSRHSSLSVSDDSNTAKKTQLHKLLFREYQSYIDNTLDVEMILSASVFVYLSV